MADSMSYQDLISGIPTSYATCSIGNQPPRDLEQKLNAIHAAGFKGCELAFPDLLEFAKSYLKKDVKENDYDSLCEVGQVVKNICKRLDVTIVMLQPFANLEGWPKGSSERADAFNRAKGWIRIMEAVGTDMLQVGSSDAPNITADPKELASDLAELADLLAPHGFRLTYENWCWATHAPTWSTVWEIVKLADRSNIGLCLDTFQTAGSEWGDPTTDSGRLEDVPQDALDDRYQASLAKLKETVPKDKIYILQISDAYKPPKPFSTEPDKAGMRPRGRWSHDFRPMPYEGGYLPIAPMARAVLETGFRGWFSMEIFDSGNSGEGKEIDDINAYAIKAMASHTRLLKELAS